MTLLLLSKCFLEWDSLWQEDGTSSQTRPGALTFPVGTLRGVRPEVSKPDLVLLCKTDWVSGKGTYFYRLPEHSEQQLSQHQLLWFQLHDNPTAPTQPCLGHRGPVLSAGQPCAVPTAPFLCHFGCRALPAFFHLGKRCKKGYPKAIPTLRGRNG